MSDKHNALLSILLIPLLLGACAPAPPGDGAASEPAAEPPAAEPTFQQAFAARAEEAFGAGAWKAKDAVEMAITVHFGGNKIVDGKLLFTPDTGKSRLDLADGTVAVFDGEKAWVSPEDSAFAGARFHLLTWPYFLAAPAKLQDPGAHLEDLGATSLGEVAYDSARLTFDAGVGDAPDDWYILYSEPATGRLAAMAYIVTFGNTKEKAEEDPHAITYEDLQTVAGIQVPMHWQFWAWNEEQGIHGDPIGEVRLREVGFPTPAPDTFAKPEGAREDALPTAG